MVHEIYPDKCPHCMATPRKPIQKDAAWVSYECHNIIKHGKDDRELQSRDCQVNERNLLQKKALALEEHVRRLEEAGEAMWKRASGFRIDDTYDIDGNEVHVSELEPEKVVLSYEHGDGISAKNMVDLIEALDGWRQAKRVKFLNHANNT